VDVGLLAKLAGEAEDAETGGGKIIELGLVLQRASGRPIAEEGADGGEAGIGEGAFEGEMAFAESGKGFGGALGFFVFGFVSEEVGAVVQRKQG